LIAPAAPAYASTPPPCAAIIARRARRRQLALSHAAVYAMF